MQDLLRQEVARAAHTVVVKLGTRVLTDDRGLLNHQRIAQLAEEIHELREASRHVVVVSSGAVGAGMGQLGLKQRPRDLAQLQAVAAIGQTHLVEAYDRALRPYGRHAAQILLTAEDLHDRTRYLNVRNTILQLFKLNAVPVINENDTVAVDELQISFGDNDRLAALVTNLLRAPLLVILSDVAGLYDRDPSDPAALRIPLVTDLNQAVMGLAQDRATGVSKGGMASKLRAARLATSAGENVIIAPGKEPGSLGKILRGEDVGTLFCAQGSTVSPWKRWIGFAVHPRGKLLLDEGAMTAILRKGRSLLAIGVIDVQGTFHKGDVLVICDQNGQEIARGLTNYRAEELRLIQGLKSTAIAAALGHCPYEEVIHRDNMVITA